MQEETTPSAIDRPEAIGEESAYPPGPETHLELGLARVREMQRWFRRQPIGGRLAGVKRLVYWLVASAFDRQAKVIEALLDLLEEVVDEMERLRHGQLPVTPPEASPGNGSVVPTGDAEQGLPSSLSTIPDLDAEMLMSEMLLLYSLVFALKPRCCLEIGTHRGGSAAIICAAMDDTGWGRLVCVDLKPQLPPALRRQLRHRVTVLAGASPEVLPRARRAVPEPFAFVLIDGDHSRRGVLRDLEGTLPQLADEAYLLFHDSHFHGVAEAIEEALRRHAGTLTDCGTLSTTRHPSVVNGEQATCGGLRLVHFRRAQSL